MINDHGLYLFDLRALLGHSVTALPACRASGRSWQEAAAKPGESGSPWNIRSSVVERLANGGRRDDAQQRRRAKLGMDPRHRQDAE
jgi:hypothetical protein